MDKISKKTLNYLIELGGCEHAIDFDSGLNHMAKNLNMNSEDLRANIRYLHDLGYIDYQKFVHSNRNAAFALSYKGLHWKYFRRKEMIKYLEEKWIDFFSLFISILSFIVSITALMS